MKFPSIDPKSFRAIVFDPSLSLTAETCPIVFEDHQYAPHSVHGDPGLMWIFEKIDLFLDKFTVPFAIGDRTSLALSLRARIFDSSVSATRISPFQIPSAKAQNLGGFLAEVSCQVGEVLIGLWQKNDILSLNKTELLVLEVVLTIAVNKVFFRP